MWPVRARNTIRHLRDPGHKPKSPPEYWPAAFFPFHWFLQQHASEPQHFWEASRSYKRKGTYNCLKKIFTISKFIYFQCEQKYCLVAEDSKSGTSCLTKVPVSKKAIKSSSKIPSNKYSTLARMEKIHQPKQIVEPNEQECHFIELFLYFLFIKWRSPTVIFYKNFW